MRKMARNRVGLSSASIWTSLALAVSLMPAAQAAGLPGAQINECNSDVSIGVSPMTPTAGQAVNVTLTVTSTDARDNMNNPIAQDFDRVLFTGDCQQPPGIPCSPSMPSALMFLGNLGGTCPGVVANPMGNGQIEFDFVPDVSLLIPAPATPVSCTVTFDVVYSAAATYAAQANTSGVCQNPGFPPGTVTSDTTVTSAINVNPGVPTLGEAALAILALILATGSWMILRRRNAGLPPTV